MPAIDIVTQMVIEGGDDDDGIDDGQIGEIEGDMVIFYDDIEIVEHSSNISSTETDSVSSNSRSFITGRPVQTIIECQPPPPIPARTLKPAHLRSQSELSPATNPRQQQQQPIILAPASKTNRTYELEKAAPLRKKIDVNTVNDILNRGDYYIGPTPTHRLRSARHFVGKINSDDSSSQASSIQPNNNHHSKPSPAAMTKSQTLPLQNAATNGHSTTPATTTTPRMPPKNSSATLPTRSLSSVNHREKRRPLVPDTDALVKQIQNSLSRNSLHDSQMPANLSASTKDLRTFVSSTYSPSDENMMDDDGIVHHRQKKSIYRGGDDNDDDQSFKRQARLSKSFHNISEYNSTDQYPKRDNNLASRALPSKSVENDLNRVSRQPTKQLNFPPIIASTSFSALPHSEDSARMLVSTSPCRVTNVIHLIAPYLSSGQDEPEYAIHRH